MRPVIHSIKNQLATSLTTVTAAQNQFNAVEAVEIGAGTKILGTETPVGAKVFRIFVSINAITDSGAGNTRIEWNLQMVRSGQVAVDTNWSTIGLSSQRNQIIHSEIAQVGTEDAGPYRFNRSIKIPRVYNRIRDGDRILVNFKSVTNPVNLVVAFRYKYYD